MATSIVITLRRELKQNADSKTEQSFQRFFKERVKHYGVKSATVGKIAANYFKKIKNLSKREIFTICEELFKSGYNEEAFIAANWTNRLNKQFTPSDYKIFKQWIETYIDNWAKCDTFCNHTMGAFIEMYPAYIPKITSWTKSKNRWVKRAAAVSFIIPARKGLFFTDILEISDNLLHDTDDIVQKGYGWMLKVASQVYPQKVFEYVTKHKQTMPRTALRYAIEKMPASLRKQALSKD